MLYPIPSIGIHDRPAGDEHARMASNNEDHGQSFDPSDALQSQGVVLLRRNDFLQIVDHRKGDNETGDDGFLIPAVVDDVDLEDSAEEQDGHEE